MVEHPLHKVVGELLEEFAKKNNFLARLDDACGGDQHIPLFLDSKSNENSLCKVDAMLLKKVNDKKEVVAVIEIEESGFIPTKICGKYLTTALSTLYDHEKDGSIVLKPKSIKFIQIVDTSSLESNSDIPEKLRKIGDSIQNNYLCGCVGSYDILLVNYNDLKDRLGTILNEVSK
jgi:hypothetical protein